VGKVEEQESGIKSRCTRPGRHDPVARFFWKRPVSAVGQSPQIEIANAAWTSPGIQQFINCPFDSEYDSLLRPILFTIIYLGYNPQIASQRSDSDEQRINKILSLILKSKFSVHDLSRIKSAKPGEFFRLNMPFELGIDYGCRRIGSEHLRRKRFLVLGEKPHDYKKALSDLGGVDAKSHANQPNKAVLALRNWFVDTVHFSAADSPTVIWYRFMDFNTEFYERRKAEGFSKGDLKMMPVSEYSRPFLKGDKLI